MEDVFIALSSAHFMLIPLQESTSTLGALLTVIAGALLVILALMVGMGHRIIGR